MSGPRVTLFDYGAGNLHSLAKAIERAGAAVRLETDPTAAVDDTDALVLPGVGAFAAAAERLAPGRDAMRAALEAHMPAGCHWTVPSGGMFFWVELPAGVDATALLPAAVELGMAYVPGAAFYAADPKPNTLRLSFVTVAPAEIERGVALLAQALRGA